MFNYQAFTLQGVDMDQLTRL